MANRTARDYGTLAPPTTAGETGVVRADTAGPLEAAGGTSLVKFPTPDDPFMLAHYRVFRLLGQGGMGMVFQAEDTRLDRHVALKVMHPELTAKPDARERFVREARAMAAVRNDHVVTIYEVGEANAVPFLAMEFLQGQTLEGWLPDGPVADESAILRIGREVAEGLAAAQDLGLVHRDIKPANIWLEASSGRVKILDFGLARPVDNRAGLTRTGDLVGTPHYMAPEQALGQPVDGRSDLFSLGVVLYRLCTGQLPFQGKTLMAVLAALAVETPVPVKELNSNSRPELADLVMRLLEKNPAKRPSSARDVAAALRALETPALAFNGTSTPPQAPRLSGRQDAAPAAPAPRRWPAPKVSRRNWHWASAALTLVISAGVISWWVGKQPAPRADGGALTPVTALAGPPLRIGVLYSRTGTMAISERSILDGVLLAVDEINEKGGVLGRSVEPVIEDGQSNTAVFARQATKLIEQDQVGALVGCWTSDIRKAVKAVVEQHDHLLLYPVSYEGMEHSRHVVYGGAVPNQHILPALRWCYGFLNKKRWSLVGTDSIFGHAAFAVIRDEAQTLGSQIVGEQVLAPGSTEVGQVVQRIAAAKPDLIINTINGDTNGAFFRGLWRAGVHADQVPVLSFRLSEEELSALAPAEVVGHYAAGNYFQSINLPENQAFLRKVEARFGPDRVVSDPMQTAYALVHLWAQAVGAAGSDEIGAIRAAIKGRRFDAPQGPMVIDGETLHTIQVSRIGRIDDRGRFQEVFLSPQPVRPEPFPASRSKQAWEELLQDCQRRWGGRWANPGP